MKKGIKIVAFLLCVLCLLPSLAACGAETLMTYGDKELSVNVYEFLLSRMKGTLAYYGYEVEKESFWNTVTDMNGTTYDEYFCGTIKEQAQNYIAADKLFDEQGLSLSQEDIDTVDELLGAYVEKAGSKSALNAELMEFGVNYDILREIYLLEAKIERLKEQLYGKGGEKISSDLKEGYFNDNYVAFRQIFLATYDYVTDKDRNGDVVYYTDEKHKKIAYDKINGKTDIDAFGNLYKDIFGDPEYYAEDGSIAYDRESGVIGYVTNKNGDKVIEELDDKTKTELYEKAKEYTAACNGNVEKFEEYIEKYDSIEDNGLIYLFSSPGYYAAQNDSVAYFDEIALELEKLEAGECKLYKSSYGYHVLCRYENETAAYENKEYEDVFESFSDDLISRLFEELCSGCRSDISLDGKVLDRAPTMKDVGVNTKY